MATDVLDTETLLKQYNPILVLYPQNGGNSPKADEPPWGDYHPCSTTFFFNHARVNERTGSAPMVGVIVRLARAVWVMTLDRLGWWRPSDPDGLENIGTRVSAVSTEETKKWDLDLARMKAWHSDHAWARYQEMIETDFECVTYARAVTQGQSVALQYWYLFAYNDFYNKHEGDWEVVTIELGQDLKPRQVRMSCHQGTFAHNWGDSVLRKDASGDRPVIRVARGSHGFYAFYGGGVRGIAEALGNWVRPRSLLKRFLYGAAASAFRLFALLLRWRDRIPADREIEGQHLQDHAYGERVDPHVVPLPNDGDFDVYRGDPDRFWLRYYGKWGSAATGIMGFMGTDSPWNMPDSRWSDPAGWVRGERW